MVDRVYESGASTTPPSPPATPSTGYPAPGDPAQGIPASRPGPYWFHQVTETLVGIVEKAGLTPDHTDHGQLLDAIARLTTGRRNIAINGDMRTDQRNEGGISTALSDYDLDRYASDANTGAWDKQRVAFGSQGFSTARKVTITTAPDIATAGNYAVPFVYKSEGFDVAHAAGRSITIQFIFTSNVTGTFSIVVQAGDASQSYVTDFTYGTAGVDQKVVVTVPIPASGVITDTTNGIGLRIKIAGVAEASRLASGAGSWVAGDVDASVDASNWAATAGNYIMVTGFQVEVGVIASNFEFRSTAEELALCQRYAYTVGRGATVVGAGMNFSTTDALIQFVFPTIMRSVPVLKFNNVAMVLKDSAGNNVAITNLTVTTFVGVNGACITASTAGSLAAGDGSVMYTGDPSDLILVDAEL